MPSPPPGRRHGLRLGYLTGLNWALLAYAALSIEIAWAYVISRVHADYEQTLSMERNRLRGVSAALEAGTLAMINDGVGAAVAGANELQATEGLILAGAPSRHLADPVDRLSGRELQVLSLLGEGRSTRETANSLHLSIKTVESHRQRIKRKLNLKTSVQLLRYAVLTRSGASSEHMREQEVIQRPTASHRRDG
jgi:DNA-binding CsgD family transcriptional regulator